ncbi:MAG: hypothetical protein ACTSUS_04340 [Candidatus Freyarchaeota archaeon]
MERKGERRVKGGGGGGEVKPEEPVEDGMGEQVVLLDVSILIEMLEWQTSDGM